MPKEIEQLAAQYLNKPVKVKIGRVSVPTANVAQSLQRCGEQEKVELLVALLQVRRERERDLDEGKQPDMPSAHVVFPVYRLAGSAPWWVCCSTTAPVLWRLMLKLCLAVLDCATSSPPAPRR